MKIKKIEKQENFGGNFDSDKRQKQIASSLYKRAIGFESNDTVEEFSVDADGVMTLIKKKVTSKYIPPDISAGKALLEFYYNESNISFQNLSDEDLLKEKKRILKLIASLNNDEAIPNINENLNIEGEE